jgi:hypothetical protein
MTKAPLASQRDSFTPRMMIIQRPSVNTADFPDYRFQHFHKHRTEMLQLISPNSESLAHGSGYKIVARILPSKHEPQQHYPGQ